MALVVYDGECGFCRFWVDYWKALTGDRFTWEPYQQAAIRFPDIPLDNFQRAVQLIGPEGAVSSAALAVFRVLAVLPEYRWLLWARLHVPGFAAASEGVYRVIAAHRPLTDRVTRFLWGRRLDPQSWNMSSWLFAKALAIIYLIAFASLGVQITGLIGAHGVLPVGDFLQSVRQGIGSAAWLRVPTIFWWSSTDRSLRFACLVGAILAAAAFFELRFIRRILFFLLFVLYLSMVSAGQTFLSFQWDFLLLETGFLAIFLTPCRARVWLFQWLLFRLMFLSGMVKWLSGDPTWHHLTALEFHYETQPLPTPVAWYMQQLPAWFQRISTGFVLTIEMALPFLIFAPRRLRHFAGYAFLILQTLIFVTGNYAFFNLLSVALCLFLFDDQWWRDVTRIRARPAHKPGWRFATAIVFCFVMLASAFVTSEALGHAPPEIAGPFLNLTAPFGVVNSYGLFAVMTTSRPEIIVEGSNDGRTWIPYEFKYKPGDPRRAPRWVEPHQPRLDWQMWFAALGNYQQNPWFVNFMVRLLQGAPEVTALLEKNPFAGGPPHYVRAEVYDYHFGAPKWWRRELKGIYFPPVSLR